MSRTFSGFVMSHNSRIQKIFAANCFVSIKIFLPRQPDLIFGLACYDLLAKRRSTCMTVEVVGVKKFLLVRKRVIHLNEVLKIDALFRRYISQINSVTNFSFVDRIFRHSVDGDRSKAEGHVLDVRMAEYLKRCLRSPAQAQVGALK